MLIQVPGEITISYLPTTACTRQHPPKLLREWAAELVRRALFAWYYGQPATE